MKDTCYVIYNKELQGYIADKIYYAFQGKIYLRSVEIERAKIFKSKKLAENCINKIQKKRIYACDELEIEEKILKKS